MTGPTGAPPAPNWWRRQSKRRRAVIVGGVALVVVGAGAAAGGKQDTAASDVAPTTAARVSRESVPRPAPAAPITTDAPTTPEATLPPATRAPEAASPTAFTVSKVIDGDTIELTDGSQTMVVRMVGIDTPETGSCGADAATRTLTALLQGQPVTITPGGDGEDTDRYGRFLRYVDVNGVDAGLRLIEDGLAIARYDSRDGYGAHTRESTYVAADSASPNDACAVPATQAPLPPPAPAPALPAPADGGACNPNYTGCVPVDSDVDCAGGSGNGPSYSGRVDVIGSDVYGLDGDGDGVGCE